MNGVEEEATAVLVELIVASIGFARVSAPTAFHWIARDLHRMDPENDRSSICRPNVEEEGSATGSGRRVMFSCVIDEK